MLLFICILLFFLHLINVFKKKSTWASCSNDVQPFYLFIMFPFSFQYLVIIYINFKFTLNYIKHYIHGQ
jgi:hypothetical protein